MPTADSPSQRPSGLVAAAGVAGAVFVASWPLLPAFLLGEHALGHPVGDLSDHFQGGWWWGGELLSGRLPTQTNLTHQPELLRLFYVDPVGALISLCLRPLGPVRAWNGMLLVQLLAAAWAGLGVGRDLSGRWAAGALTGVAIGTAPFVLGVLHSGFSEYLGLVWVVLAVWLTLRGTGLDPRGRAAPPWAPVGLALLAVLLALQAPYYLAFVGLFQVLCLAQRPSWPRARAAGGMALGSGVAAAWLWGVVAPFHAGTDAAVRPETAPGWHSGPPPATDLQALFWPGSDLVPDLAALGNPGVVHVAYVGWALMVLAGLGMARSARGRCLMSRVGVFFVLCLGPTLAVGGQPLQLGGGDIALPLRLLYPLGFGSVVHHPYRMVGVLLVVLAALGAVALRRSSVRLCVLAAGLVLAEGLVLSPAPWPVPTAQVRPPDVYAALPAGPVIDWPPDATVANRAYLRWQVGHGRPIPYGTNVFLPWPLRSGRLVSDLLRLLEDPALRAQNRDVPPGRPPVVDPAHAARPLHEWGFVGLVLHPQFLSHEEAERSERLLRVRLGAPVAQAEDGAMSFLLGQEGARSP